jgi:hypothetical protein
MKIPRLFEWLIATVVLLAIIGTLYPQQLPVSLYKLSLVTMGGIVGYWLDRSLFPYARPDSFLEITSESEEVCDVDIGFCKVLPWKEGETAMAVLFAISMLRRAIIVGTAMLAIGLGA